MTPVAMSWASAATSPTTETPGPRTSTIPRTTTMAAATRTGMCRERLAMEGGHHDVEHRGTDQPGAEGPQGVQQREPQCQDEPRGALPFGIQERHPKRVCRKGFRRQQPIRAHPCPGRIRQRHWLSHA